MSQQTTVSDWPVLGKDDPPLDLDREEAAFARERDRLLRDHAGKVVLIHGADIIGVFENADDALHEGVRRFGLVKMVIREITPDLDAEYISQVDVNHPSFIRLF